MENNESIEFEPVIYEFKFKLDRSGNKFKCPKCEKKTFNRFLNEFDYYEGSDYGICDNIKCGFQNYPIYSPDAYEYCNNDYEYFKRECYLSMHEDYLTESMKDCVDTNFARYLRKHLDEEQVSYLINKYKIGKVNYEIKYCDVFWRLNSGSIIKNGKLVSFDLGLGRIKNIYSKNWMVTSLFGSYKFDNSFFGEHLIPLSKEKVIAIVENEMTAVICDYFWPEYIWIAVGGLDEMHLYDDYFTCSLKSRKVIIFPDSTIPHTPGIITCFEWKDFADRILDSFLCDITIGSLLKDKISDLSKEDEDLLMKLLCYCA